MQNELLLEIGTEEIPAGFLVPAMHSMEQALAGKLRNLNLAYEQIRVAATPRRLAIWVNGLIDRQQDREEEILGPPKKFAYDQDNQPTKAAAGFARSQNVPIEDLTIVSTPKGDYLGITKKLAGKKTEILLQTVLPQIIQELSFPKSMRWGSGKISFARPIQWLLALYNGKVIPFQFANLTSADTSKGHRFMADQTIAVKNAEDYVKALRKAHVLVEPEERKQKVIEEINRAARQAGGNILQDEELVDTVANLVEEPHAVCGSFEERFLKLPKDVLITAMREHQKYFVVVDESNNLLPYFIAVNNTRVEDAEMAAAGHQRVLRARLEDALFFFKEDQSRTLADRHKDLSGIIFQAKLGTLAEKSDRIATLAGKLAGTVSPELADITKRAAFLAKTDLLTAMVNEFPSLQGTMGHDYALLDGEDQNVATAITEHYMPVRAGGDLPVTIPGALVSLADRLDTIAGCFGIGQLPTGTTDPYGLRRLALGLLHIISDKGFSLSLSQWLREALVLYDDKLTEDHDVAAQNIMEFFKGRYVNDQIARGIPLEALEAVTSVSFDDIQDCSLRVSALVAISGQKEFSKLAGAFKRVMNIIKDHQESSINETLLAEPAEKVLYQTLQAVQESSAPFLTDQNYLEAMGEILKMKEPVDTFFDEVLVMEDDPKIRENRLSLLRSIARLFLKVGDFSKMYTLTPSNQGS